MFNYLIFLFCFLFVALTFAGYFFLFLFNLIRENEIQLLAWHAQPWRIKRILIQIVIQLKEPRLERNGDNKCFVYYKHEH